MRPLILIALPVLLSFSACSVLKGKPAERAGFIPNVLTLKDDRERSPYHGVWFADEDQFYKRMDECNKIAVLPVRTDFLLAKGWWSSLNEIESSSYEKEVGELATYFKQELERALKEHPKNRWEIVEEPDDSTFILEYALVEVIATKVHINAAGTALGAFVTGGGLVSATAGGSVAFEAKIYDGRDGELLAALADRETDKVSVVSLRDYTFYGHSRQAIREWAEQSAELANTSRETQVGDSYPINLSPW